jgi:hypothetical protein
MLKIPDDDPNADAVVVAELCAFQPQFQLEVAAA